MDLAERLEALASRNSGPLAEDLPDYSDEEAKEWFCEYLRVGFTPTQAAQKCGRTISWFRRRRNRGGANYDVDFTDRYDEIMAPDGEHRSALVENARTALVEAAKAGNVRAIEKLLMAFDPDFQFLRPAHIQGDVNIENFVQLMPGIPTELLQQMREALAASKQRELPVIDAA